MAINKFNKISALLLCGAAAAGVMTSCQSDDSLGEGEGNLQLRMEVSATLTRATPDNVQELRDACTVYLSSSKGLIYKFNGVDNVPAIIPLKSGGYVAEAWTGDSVSASFDKKFYRGYQPFEIKRGETTPVTVDCHIANVVAAVAPDESVAGVLQDYTVTVGHTRASLEFTPDMDASVRGYFMMPDGDDSLNWAIDGTDLSGAPFHKEGVITGVERAHEYTINMKYTQGESEPFGGGLITVTIDDRCLVVEDVVTITGAPSITGVGFDLNAGLAGEPGKFERRSLYVEAIGSITSMKVHADKAAAMGLPASDFDFITMDDSQRAQMAAAGISCEYAEAEGRASARLFMEATMLNALPEGEYSLTLTAVDSQGKRRERTLVIQVTNSDVKLIATPWQEIYATRATLHGEVTKESAQSPGFRYRVRGTSHWTEVQGTASGSGFSATVTGLLPGTTYEYQAKSAMHVNTSSMEFTTESVFTLPNAGFEEWSTAGDKALMASADAGNFWWDSGNHGSAGLGKQVTTNNSDVKHSGNYSALLKSQFAGVGSLGKFAAGNLFAGTFDGLQGLSGAKLTFGRPFNGSRPAKLTGYAYYKPATVNYAETGAGLSKGDMDNGIIYVAITTGPVSMDTSDKTKLFNPHGDYIVAYGEIVFTEVYGSAQEMRKFEIELKYNDLSALSRAQLSTLVLTASASRYGDYFTGGDSELYIDDLKLEY